MKTINKKALSFLNEIKNNNNREWFLENKDRYLIIKKELEAFANQWYLKLNQFDESIQNMESEPYMFRIYRDARFAKGRPYKNNHGLLIADWWKPSMHKRAGYFLNIEPGNNFLVWWAYAPEAEWLHNMRNNIVNAPDEIKGIISNSKFKKAFEIRGSKLKTAPRWFAKDHPEIELLRYKGFYALHNFTDDEVLAEDFLIHLASLCKILHPFDSYLNKLAKK